MKPPVRRDDLVFPELSYQIVGCAYEVFDELGPGHLEKIYQRAFAISLKRKEIKYAEQVGYLLKFKDEIVGKGILDFCVDDKVIVELKKDGNFSKTHIEQVLNYLKLSDLKLSILINFTKEGVKFKRIVNINK
ncbi:MAG: GxxExxY protein [Bacteroidetes bacterium]|nr:GxxExxY protein [Bacteroidota bacterium]